MSNYNQEQQTAIVEDAMRLTAAIEAEERELNRLRAETYPAPPAPPVRRVIEQSVEIKPQYPPAPKSGYTYLEHCKQWLKRDPVAWVLLIVLSLIFIIKAYVDYLAVLKQKNDELARTPEYLAARAEAERVAAEKTEELRRERRLEQEACDAEYQAETENYETVLLPRYERERELWTVNHDRMIALISEDLEVNTETLRELYDTTRLISASYRQLYILNWLYTDMSTSDHDIERATDLLDRDRQRAATVSVRSAVENMAADMRNGFAELYGAIQEGNEIQLESLGVLKDTRKLVKKTKRDMNIGNLVGAVQRRKTNKILEGES